MKDAKRLLKEVKALAKRVEKLEADFRKIKTGAASCLSRLEAQGRRPCSDN